MKWLVIFVLSCSLLEQTLAVYQVFFKENVTIESGEMYYIQQNFSQGDESRIDYLDAFATTFNITLVMQTSFSRNTEFNS